MGAPGNQYHPTHGRIGAANVEAGAGGFTVNPSGTQPYAQALMPYSGQISDPITAATTHTLAAATQLTKALNYIGTCANSGDCVKLPIAVAGMEVVVFNGGADPAAVFPGQAADTIDGGSAGASVTLTNAKRAIYTCFITGAWISAQLGVASA